MRVADDPLVNAYAATSPHRVGRLRRGRVSDGILAVGEGRPGWWGWINTVPGLREQGMSPKEYFRVVLCGGPRGKCGRSTRA